MFSGANMAVAVAALSVVLGVLVVLRPDVTRVRDGRVLAFLALFLLPCMAVWAGVSQHMERAKTTEFCLSCHTMEDYGRSLYVDDRSYLPAAHFQNNRVPRDKACYTCHTDYAMFGGLKDKWRGLSHVYVQYFGTIPGTGEIKLYQPFNNRECLHCHAGARSYLETSAHQKSPDLLQKANNNELSCMSSRCHDTIHDVTTLADATLWKEIKN
jgi:nitrate/TMAO reductase-like tetraheme cytochrome c subunit